MSLQCCACAGEGSLSPLIPLEGIEAMYHHVSMFWTKQ